MRKNWADERCIVTKMNSDIPYVSHAGLLQDENQIPKRLRDSATLPVTVRYSVCVMRRKSEKRTFKR